LVDFLGEYKQLLMKDKNASHNIEVVMRQKNQPQVTRPNTELRDYSEDIIRYVASKLSERFSKMSLAFRFLD